MDIWSRDTHEYLNTVDLGIQSLPYIHGYRLTQVETHQQDRMAVTQRSIDALLLAVS